MYYNNLRYKMIGGAYMYGAFWTIYWSYWANRRKEEIEQND